MRGNITSRCCGQPHIESRSSVIQASARASRWLPQIVVRYASSVFMHITAYVLIAFGGLMSLLNWGTVVVSWRTKRFVSAVPLVGAVPLGYGLALIPETRPFAWFALVADYGTLVLIIALPRIVYDAWSTSRINLSHCFTTNAKQRAITIKLFRRQVAVISAVFDPPVPCNDYDARIHSFGLVGTWSPAELGYSIKGFASGGELFVSKANGAFATVELNYPTDKKYNYDSLDGLQVQEQK